MLVTEYLPTSYTGLYLPKFGKLQNGFRFNIRSESVLSPDIECNIESCNVILKIKNEVVASTIASTERAQLRWIYNQITYFGEKYNTSYWFQLLLSELLFRVVIDEKNFLDYFTECFFKEHLSFKYPNGQKEKEYAKIFLTNIPNRFKKYAYATARENMEQVLNLFQNTPHLYKILERTLSFKGKRLNYPLEAIEAEKYFIEKFNKEVKLECLLDKVSLI